MCSTLWLWLHPSISSSAWKLLTSLDYITLSQEPSASSLKLIDCTGHLCRFKLIGPFSHQIVADIIKPHSTSGEWPLWEILCDYQKAGLLPTGCVLALLCRPFLTNRYCSILVTFFPRSLSYRLYYLSDFRPHLKLYNRNWLIPVPKEGKVAGQMGGSFLSRSLTLADLNKLRSKYLDIETNTLFAQWFSSSEPCCLSDASPFLSL